MKNGSNEMSGYFILTPFPALINLRLFTYSIHPLCAIAFFLIACPHVKIQSKNTPKMTVSEKWGHDCVKPPPPYF
jgi:hypothetical protein